MVQGVVMLGDEMGQCGDGDGDGAPLPHPPSNNANGGANREAHDE